MEILITEDMVEVVVEVEEEEEVGYSEDVTERDTGGWTRKISISWKWKKWSR